jgi:4-diphosphocytidyl-2-C-methyl-D-erythritol kinase
MVSAKHDPTENPVREWSILRANDAGVISVLNFIFHGKFNYICEMITLNAPCKINLGLRVLRRRPDGFHDIETVMMTVRGLADTVAVTAMPTPRTFVSLTPVPYPAPQPVFPTSSVLETSGTVAVDCPDEENICMRALRLMQREYGIGEAVIRLHKTIPTGAGLGGGSADAAAVLRAISGEFVLDLPEEELERLGAELGSDVPFFVRASAPRRGHSEAWLSGLMAAQLCTGRGEVMNAVYVDLAGKWLAIAKPDVAVSTAGAYAGITPREDGLPLLDILRRPVAEWRGRLVNDFEPSVVARYPEIGALRDSFYDSGALYASMSGSGSAVFAIFDRRPRARRGRLHVERIMNHES